MTDEPLTPEQDEAVAGVAPEEEALGDDAGRGLIGRLMAEEFGEELAKRFDAAWQRLDEWDRRHNVSEGLRERKKRLTRQRISDVATAMFASRGYDEVTVSEIAEKVGVSEKTIYNYFPTKESLVYDQADSQLMRLAAAIRDRPRGSSPTSAFVGTLKADMARFGAAIGEGSTEFFQAFGEMIRATPALRAAWGEHRHKMVETLTAVLADEAGIDPRDPEPITAARALVSLLELFHDSQMRHLHDGMSAAELRAAVEADVDRAARLLDTGLWSLHLMVEGRRTKDQLRDAANAAEQARQQVMNALREAKRAWREIMDENRGATRADAHTIKQQAQVLKVEIKAQAKAQAKAKARAARDRGR